MNLFYIWFGTIPGSFVLLIKIGFNYILGTQVSFQWFCYWTTTLWLTDLLSTVQSVRLDGNFDSQNFVLGLLRCLRTLTFHDCMISSIIHQVNGEYFLLSLFACKFISLKKFLWIKVIYWAIQRLLNLFTLFRFHLLIKTIIFNTFDTYLLWKKKIFVKSCVLTLLNTLVHFSYATKMFK